MITIWLIRQNSDEMPCYDTSDKRERFEAKNIELEAINWLSVSGYHALELPDCLSSIKQFFKVVKREERTAGDAWDECGKMSEVYHIDDEDVITVVEKIGAIAGVKLITRGLKTIPDTRNKTWAEIFAGHGEE